MRRTFRLEHAKRPGARQGEFVKNFTSALAGGADTAKRLREAEVFVENRERLGELTLCKEQVARWLSATARSRTASRSASSGGWSSRYLRTRALRPSIILRWPNADRVRGRHRLGDAGHDLDPARERHRADAALALTPLHEIAVIGEFALEEKRRRVELHVVEPRDVVAIAERVADQAEEPQLALEAAQPILVETEFEHASLLQCCVLGQPHLAETAFTELLHHLPVAASGDLHALRRPPAERLFIARAGSRAGPSPHPAAAAAARCARRRPRRLREDRSCP